MTLPTINDVQAVEPILTNMLIGYQQADDRFVAGRVFPIVPVEKDSGTYYVFDKKYFFMDDLKPRAPGGQFIRLDVGVSTDTYKTLQWAGSADVSDEERANSQIPMDLETAKVRKIAQSSLIRKERAWAADFMITGVWGTSNTTATDWDDFTNGDPVTDVALASDTISDNTGYTPNTMVMGKIVHRAIVAHPDILDRLKYTTAATKMAVEAALASIFGLDQYLVARASYNTANEGQTFSASAIVDDDCLVCYVNQSAGIFDATAGKTFSWAGGGGQGSMYSYYSNDNHSAVIQHKEQWDQKITASDLGYIFLDVV